MASPRHDENVALLESAEKLETKSFQNSSTAQDRQLRRTGRMTLRPSVILVLMVCLLTALGMSAAVAPRNVWRWRPCHRGPVAEQGSVPEPVQTTFLNSLSEASPESLHDLLHKFFPDKFQHGVFPSEQQAVEAVHEVDPAIASTIIQMARRDTNSSSSTTSTPPPTSSSSSSSTTVDSSTSTKDSSTTTTTTQSSVTGSSTTKTTASSSSSSGTSTSRSESTSSVSQSSKTTSRSSLASSSSEGSSSTGGMSAQQHWFLHFVFFHLSSHGSLAWMLYFIFISRDVSC